MRLVALRISEVMVLDNYPRLIFVYECMFSREFYEREAG